MDIHDSSSTIPIIGLFILFLEMSAPEKRTKQKDSPCLNFCTFILDANYPNIDTFLFLASVLKYAYVIATLKSKCMLKVVYDGILKQIQLTLIAKIRYQIPTKLSKLKRWI